MVQDMSIQRSSSTFIKKEVGKYIDCTAENITLAVSTVINLILTARDYYFTGLLQQYKLYFKGGNITLAVFNRDKHGFNGKKNNFGKKQSYWNMNGAV